MAQTLVPRTCRRCDKAFTVTLQRFNHQRKLFGENGAAYCSRACFNDPSKYEQRACRACDAPFRVLKTTIGNPKYPGLYCSRSCIPSPVGKVGATCPACKRDFTYYASVRKNPPRSCGWKCPARDPNERIQRVQTAAWKKRRAEVIARDGGRCRRCGTSPSVPVVHHVVAWVQTRDDSPENLITLCRPCHAIVEGFAEGSGQPDWEARCRAS